MTPKEALREICLSSHCVSEKLRIDLKPYQITERKTNVYNALTELEELKRYPTSEEVCEALSECWGNPVRYDERHCLFEMYVGDNTWKPVELLRMRTEKSSLITLIGKFYEGLGK